MTSTTASAVPIRPSPQKLDCVVLTPVSALPAGQSRHTIAPGRPAKRPLPPPAALRGIHMRHRRGGYSAYVPHQQPATVLKRNARERNRVKQVNHGFTALRNHIPGAARNKKLSKVDTLRKAIEYIQSLQRQLDDREEEITDEDLHGYSGTESEREGEQELSSPEYRVQSAGSSTATYTVQQQEQQRRLQQQRCITLPEEGPTTSYMTPQPSPATKHASPLTSPAAEHASPLTSPLTLTPSSLTSVDSGFSECYPAPSRVWPLQSCPDTLSPSRSSYGFSCPPATYPGAYPLQQATEGFSSHEDEGLSPEDEELLDAIVMWQSNN